MKTQPVPGSPGSVLIAVVGASVASQGPALPSSPVSALHPGLCPAPRAHRAPGWEPPGLVGPGAGQQLGLPRSTTGEASLFFLSSQQGLASPWLSPPILVLSFLSPLTYPERGECRVQEAQRRSLQSPLRAWAPLRPQRCPRLCRWLRRSTPPAPRSFRPEPRPPPETGPSHLGAWEVP